MDKLTETISMMERAKDNFYLHRRNLGDISGSVESWVNNTLDDLKKLKAEKETSEKLKDSLAYLETLANFGGTIQQARELAQKAVTKLKT